MKSFLIFNSTVLQFTKCLRPNYSQLVQKKFSVSACLCSEITKSSQTSSGEGSKDENTQLVDKKSNLPHFIPEEDQPIVNELKKESICHPYKSSSERVYKILLEDVKVGVRQVVKSLTNIQLGDLEVKYFPRHTDVLVIGSGAIGLSIAYALRSKTPRGVNIIVVDKDNNFPHLSTNLAQGTLLQQQWFTEMEEIEMAQYCAEFLSTFHRHTEVDGHPQFKLPYEPMGSLFLADKNNAREFLKKFDTLKMYKTCNKILQHGELKNKFPWLKVDDILFGSLGISNEGLFDPWLFLIALKCKSINLGITFVTAEVIDFGTTGSDVIRRVVCRLPDGTYNSIDFACCVIAAGKESINLNTTLHTSGGLLKVNLPIEERKRYEYCFYNPDGPGLNTPIVVDTDGTYFRREGLAGYYVAGVPSVAADGNEENGLYEVFNSKVKPFLTKRLPQFEKLNLVTAWVDTYDFITANEIGILSPHPVQPQIVFANGFSKNGLLYVPAVGRAAMELIYFNEYKTINFERFHFENLYRKQQLEADKRRQERIQSQHRIALNE